MKKNKFVILDIFAIFLGFLFFLNIDNLLAFSMNWIIIFAFLPMVFGVFLALLQNEDRSYRYLPKILIHSLIFSFLTIFFIKLFIYFTENLRFDLLTHMNPFKDKDEFLGHIFFAGLATFGGLVGVMVRGINLIFFKNKRFKIKCDIGFLWSFLAGALLLFGANSYYIFIHTPPDGRWKFELPVTSTFILIYLLFFFIVSKNLIKKKKYNYLPGAYNIFLSLVFLTNAEAIQVYFQDKHWQYFKYIATAPYIFILGFGLVLAVFVFKYLPKVLNKK